MALVPSFNTLGKLCCTHHELDMPEHLSSMCIVATLLHLVKKKRSNHLLLGVPCSSEFNWRKITWTYPNAWRLLCLRVKLRNPCFISSDDSPCRFWLLIPEFSRIDWHHSTLPLFWSHVRACGTQQAHCLWTPRYLCSVQDQIACRVSNAYDVLYLPVCSLTTCSD